MNDPALIGLDEVAAVHTGLAPLYHSLGHVIRSKIQSGEWSVGQQIPSERVLMDMFGVSRATVRQGIENLVKEGILYRAHGRGTFVAPPKIKQGLLRLLEFSDIMRRSGFNPSARLLGKECIDPPLNIRKVLAFSNAEAAVWLQRLLLVNEVPILIETSYFSAARFPDLLEVYDGIDEPHLFIYKHYGVKIIRASETLEPVIMESQEARTLGVKRGFPALWVEHIAYDAAGKPVAFLTTLLRGDRCRFYTELNDTS
jgi:GntR family transcriptional regulator